MPTSIIQVDSGLRKLQKLLQNYEVQGLNARMDSILDEAINVMTTSVQLYMPARHRLSKRNPKAQQVRVETSTGRLWSGWGKRQSIVHSDEGKIKDNPTSPNDNYFYVKKIGSGAQLRFVLVTGTNIPYATYVDEGRPKWHKGRPEYDFKRLGRNRALRIIRGFADGALRSDVTALEKRSQAQSFRAIGQARGIGPSGKKGVFVPRGSITSFIP